ncbi:hypothetical protein RIF29_41072 [Crotalaria pallida]|uniref:Uncharacterized protein n=1 Tax=Crotalaria pallida TaxID=3830 RepID=A0AAN9HSA2_CROPI
MKINKEVIIKVYDDVCLVSLCLSLSLFSLFACNALTTWSLHLLEPTPTPPSPSPSLTLFLSISTLHNTTQHNLSLHSLFSSTSNISFFSFSISFNQKPLKFHSFYHSRIFCSSGPLIKYITLDPSGV